MAVQAELSAHFTTDSYNIAINEGEYSGRSIPHLHWQIIPRWKKIYSAIDVFADIHVVTLAPAELKEMLSKRKAGE